MKIGGYRQSGNVEDRRGMGPGMLVGGGGLGALAIAVIVMLLGGDPGEVLNQTAPGPASQGQPGQRSDDNLAVFSRQVLASTEDVWSQVAPGYTAPTLVLYDGVTDAGGCGTGQSAMGPFYCPADRKLYLDLSFFRELSQKFGAPGDFAAAYVIAHEVGHHVQRLTGASRRAQMGMEQAGGRRGANQISVRLELQADCYAGVWGKHAERQGLLEAGDLDEAMRAAESVGDDRLQEAAQGRVMPDSFTHGSAAQRKEWFQRGFQTGDPKACDTGV